MYQFSIILPVRNGGEYVKECVNSILAQTYPHFNLIVLDNNSIDGTKEWIESLNNNKIIIYSSNQDLSITENWGRAIEVTTNEFMTLIGHDDILYPNFLEVISNLINQNPDASLFQTHFNFINENGNLVRPCKPMNNKLSASEFLNCQFNQTLDSTGSGYVFRAKDYKLLGGISQKYPNLIFADYELWFKLISKNYIALSNKFCFAYRLHDSTSKTTNGQQYQDAFLKYIQFLIGIRKLESVKNVLDKNGKKFLIFFCESLSHRILKTPINIRSVSVNSFVKECIKLSKNFIPQQKFQPYLKIKILAAILLDNVIGRKLFSFAKKIIYNQ